MKTFHDCYFISLQSLEKFIVLVVDFFSVSCDLPVTKKVFFVIGVTRQLNHHKKSFYTKSAKFKYQTLWQNAKISGFQPTKITDIPVVAVSWRIESAAESLRRSRGCGLSGVILAAPSREGPRTSWKRHTTHTSFHQLVTSKMTQCNNKKTGVVSSALSMQMRARGKNLGGEGEVQRRAKVHAGLGLWGDKEH